MTAAEFNALRSEYVILRHPYPMLLIIEGDGYIADVPALPGCVTQGDAVGVQVLTVRVTVKVDAVDGRVRSRGVVETASAAPVGT